MTVLCYIRRQLNRDRASHVLITNFNQNLSRNKIYKNFFSDAKYRKRNRFLSICYATLHSGLILMGGRIFLSFCWNFNVKGINVHQKVEDRTTKTERLLEKDGPFNFKLLVVPHLKFWKWQSKIFSLQKLKAILVLFKTVKSIVAMACRIFSKHT